MAQALRRTLQRQNQPHPHRMDRPRHQRSRRKHPRRPNALLSLPRPRANTPRPRIPPHRHRHHSHPRRDPVPLPNLQAHAERTAPTLNRERQLHRRHVQHEHRRAGAHVPTHVLALPTHLRDRTSRNPLLQLHARCPGWQRRRHGLRCLLSL